MDMKETINRLHRIDGQIKSLVTKIEQGEDCDKVIMQLAAIRGGINSALETYIDQQLETCTSKDTDRIRKLLRTLLSRHT